jgi:hypothetical protein
MGIRRGAPEKKVIQRVVRVYEQVETGLLYDKAVQLMTTYRSTAARMGNAHRATQGTLDKQLIKLSEQISEALSELTDMERMALDCWQDGVVDDTYEIDHDAITAKPYVSIRKIERVTEEYDVDERKEQLRRDRARQQEPESAEDIQRREQRRRLMRSVYDDEY